MRSKDIHALRDRLSDCAPCYLRRVSALLGGGLCLHLWSPRLRSSFVLVIFREKFFWLDKFPPILRGNLESSPSGLYIRSKFSSLALVEVDCPGNDRVLRARFRAPRDREPHEEEGLRKKQDYVKHHARAAKQEDYRDLCFVCFGPSIRFFHADEDMKILWGSWRGFDGSKRSEKFSLNSPAKTFSEQGTENLKTGDDLPQLCESLFKTLWKKKLYRALRTLHRHREDLLEKAEKSSKHDAYEADACLLRDNFHLLDGGLDEISLPDLSGNLKHIILDPRLSPAENVSKIFRAARRARKSGPFLKMMLERCDKRFRMLDLLKTEMDAAPSPESIQRLFEKKEELPSSFFQEAKEAPKKKEGQHIPGVKSYKTKKGSLIWVGANAQGNEHATFRLARGRDLWLHRRDGPGPHVVLRPGFLPCPEEDFMCACQLACAHLDEKSIEILWTERKFIKKGKRPGEVFVGRQRHKLIFKDPAILPRVCVRPSGILPSEDQAFLERAQKEISQP